MKGWWPTSYLFIFPVCPTLALGNSAKPLKRPQHIWPKGLKMIYGFDRIWWNSFGWYYKHARMMLYLKCWPFFSQDPFFSVPHSTKKSPMLTSGSSTPYASAILGRGWTEWKHPRVAQRSDAFVTLRDSILLDLGQGKHGSKIGKRKDFQHFHKFGWCPHKMSLFPRSTDQHDFIMIDFWMAAHSGFEHWQLFLYI